MEKTTDLAGAGVVERSAEEPRPGTPGTRQLRVEAHVYSFSGLLSAITLRKLLGVAYPIPEKPAVECS